jgi:hypothetical protein
MTDFILTGCIILAISGELLLRDVKLPNNPAISFRVRESWKYKTRLTLIPLALIIAALVQFLFPSMSVDLITISSAGLGWLVDTVVKSSTAQFSHRRRTQQLNFALTPFLQQVRLRITGGNSLQKALTSADNVGNQDIEHLQNLLRSGMDIERSSKLWLDDFQAPAKQRLADLWSTKTTTSEMLALIENLLQWLNSEQRFFLTSEIERRNQLVWIPVTVAVLLPGMIFIAIPLEATLKTLLK